MKSLDEVIPDWDALLHEIIDNHPFRHSQIHGEPHWKSVALTGHYLLSRWENPAVDPIVVLLFAIFHDSKRENDGFDCCHGKRAGLYARRLHGKYHFLSADQMDLLQRACHGHVDGEVTNNPTIGLCWDSDRLNLFRIGIKVEPDYLSTSIARNPDVPEKVKELEKWSHRVSWEEIRALYQRYLESR